MPFEIRTVFPAGAQGVVCVLVDGSQRALARGDAGVTSSSPRALTIVGDACVAIRGAAAIAEARRLRTPIRRATTSNE